MKFNIRVKNKDCKYMEVRGKKHKLKLYNGEIIEVTTDKRMEFWFITDIETGYCVIPSSYYGFLNYDPQHDVLTERNALETAKFCIDRYLKSNNITFSQWRERRLSENGD